MSPLRARAAARTALTLTLLGALMLSALALAGCRRGGEASTTQLRVQGSTTIQPIAEMAKEMYEEAHPGVTVLVAGVGSSAGIESVASGSSEIGTSSRDLKPAEAGLGLVDTPIAHDAIAVIVNPANPVSGLSKAQVAAIFEGRIKNWDEVGGPDLEIGIVNRDEASGTREAFSKIVLGGKPFDPTAAVLPGTGQVRFVVAQARGAIGYISVGFVDKTVKALSVDGVEPTEANITNKTYPISRLLHFLTKGEPEGLAKEFLAFVLSPAVQETVVREAGFLPMGGEPK
ncbi:MAG: phosphate ABC transporter substrate-binding protein [Coriobacteriia bacterium]|nr:phosphate ABC transporter substrate-binding protein [Coriobacteriia bacterium]